LSLWPYWGAERGGSTDSATGGIIGYHSLMVKGL
jgi:hypothetical protein